MDLCAGLLIFGLVVAGITIIGHALWVLAALIIGAVAGPRKEEKRRSRVRCVRCGTIFSRTTGNCPSCGLDPGGQLAQELDEVDASVRNVQFLVNSGALTADVGEQVYRALETLQSRLLQRREPAPGDQPAGSAEISPSQIQPQLEQLLGAGVDVRDLSSSGRRQALFWYRRLKEDDLTRFSPNSLVGLARILRMAGLPTRAIRTYELLLRAHAGIPEAAKYAFEAGQYALKEQEPEKARSFLLAALNGCLTPEEQQEARTALASLPEAESIPAALLVPEIPAAPSEQQVSIVTPHSEEAPIQPLPAPPPTPRRSWGEMLAGFMEERNILWGELVGGLLIVGCSIALVISLWQTLEQIPYFPFLAFLGITSALFGAGLYTLRHWKLEATSRGLLVIATLLTPLDFLVLAGLARGRQAGLLDWGTEIAALAIFFAMTVASGRILVRPALSVGFWKADWLLAIAVVGTAGSQLFVQHWLESARPTPWLFALLSLVPVMCQLFAVGAVLVGLIRSPGLEPRTANVFLLFLGQTAFAVGVALGFIVYWNEEAALETFRYLAVAITTAAIPLALGGALVQRKLESPPSGAGETGLPPAITRLIGSAIALGGMSIMLAALLLAWPRPLALVVVAGLNATVFFLMALEFRLACIQVPALTCVVIGVVTAFHWLTGNLSPDDPDLAGHLIELALSPASGMLLAGLAVLFAATSEWLLRTGRRLDAIIHINAAGVAIVLALILVAAEGRETPLRGAAVFGVAGIGALAVNLRRQKTAVTIAGSFACLGSILYFAIAIFPDLALPRQALLALSIHATASVLLGLALARTAGAALKERLCDPLWQSGIFTSVVALLPLAFSIQWTALMACASYALWISVIWLVTAWVKERPELFSAFQALLAGAVLLGITGWLGGQPWVAQDARRLVYVWSLQTYALGFGVLSLLWAGVRLGLRGHPRVHSLIEPPWPPVDRVIFGLLVIGQLVLASVSLWPEVVREIGPRAADGWLERVLSEFANVRPLDQGKAWALLAILTLGLILALWDSWSHEAVLGLVLAALTVPVMTAHSFRDELAAGSALRWGLGGAFLFCSLMLWMRDRLWPWAERGRIQWQTTQNVPRLIRLLLLVLCLTPVILLTAWCALAVFDGRLLAGPATDSLFAMIGQVSPLLIPMGMIFVGLAGHGVRENSGGYMFAAGLAVVAMLAGGHALAVIAGGTTFDMAQLVYTAQLAVLALSGWGLAWLASGRWLGTMGKTVPRSLRLLGEQSFLSIIGNLLLLVPALITVLTNAGGAIRVFAEQACQPLGWIGLLATLAGAVWVMRLASSTRMIHVVAGGGAGMCILAACVAGIGDPTGWRAYHVLTVTGTLLSLLLLACAWIGSSAAALGPMFWSPDRRVRAAALLKELCPAAPVRRWVEILCGCVVFLALGGAWGDPARPYWSSAATLAVSLLLGTMAVWVRRPAYVYLSGSLFCLVGYLVWQSWLVDHWGLDVWVAAGPELFDRLLLIEVICLGIASCIWSLVELALRRREPPIDLRSSALPFTHAAGLLALHLVAILVLTGLIGDLFHSEIHFAGVLAWCGWLATLVAVLLWCWDPEAQAWGLPAAPLYVLGLCALGLGLHQFSLEPRMLIWTAGLLLAGFLLLSDVLVPLTSRPSGLRRRLHLPLQSQPWFAGWLLPAQLVQASLVLGLSLWMCLDFPLTSERLGGPLVVLLLTGAGIALSRNWPDLTEGLSQTISQREYLLFTVLGLIVATATQLTWALLDPASPAPWLHRQVLLVTVLVALAAIYRTALARRLPAEWASCASRSASVLAGFAAMGLLAVLVQEFILYDPQERHTPLALWSVILVVCLLAAILSAGLWIAVSRRNPLQLSERGRVAGVWAAEFVFLLLLLHLRLNVPDLFPSFLGRNWTLVLITIGFLSAGLGELFERRGLPMLSGPLRQTGLFLPLLPVLAYLIQPLGDIRVLGDRLTGLQPVFRYLDHLPHSYEFNALLWFLLGALYALVAVLRRGSALALVAALFANFGLWVIYTHQEGLGFLLHPQLWLIPLGLILLAAEHLNRERLTPASSQTVRYAGLGLIYLSSSADMFIAGLGHSVVMPLVLAVLSTAGVMAGILLRVRAFLFMGIAFLFLVVFSQIWHAAVDREQTWVWWASGIVLGAAILTLFALFEKRRNDVLRLVDEIKRWH